MSAGLYMGGEKIAEASEFKPGPSLQPTVCCVMLTRDRPEMARRAVEAFRAQTYQNKRLLIWDSGHELTPELETEDNGVYWCPTGSSGERAGLIGELRNQAVSLWTEFPIIIHWDDDDYSHPNRIAEQVALLQSTGAAAVGYRDMLFWDQRPCQFCGALKYENRDARYCLGTSLCYWRKTWEETPFEALPAARGGTGEDTRFLHRLWDKGQLTVGVPSFGNCQPNGFCTSRDRDPRMIARIHGGNSQDYTISERSPSWRRAAEWDDYARKVMA